MLEEDEWEVIKELVLILKPFAEATNYLGNNKYCTYTIMVPTLIKIINRIKPLTTESKKFASEINFNNYENIFEEEISIENDEEKPNPTAAKKLKINDPVNTKDLVKKIKLALYIAMKHYWNDFITPKTLLPSLLDPRIKDLSFVTVKQRFDAEEFLSDIYEQEKALKLSSNSIFDLTQEEEENDSQIYDSIFASFKTSTIEEINEVTDYLG
jgi:hypothetical protein